MLTRKTLPPPFRSCRPSWSPGRRQAPSAAAPKPLTRAARTLPTVFVYPATPMAGAGIDADKVPASVNVVDANQIKQSGSLNISDALQQHVPGIIVNEVAGNPFQPDVQFRGFVASPVAGTPQGLAVYQNGVRINEAFGDTVNWDLIPTAAMQSVAVVTNNPAFGLNALGGRSQRADEGRLQLSRRRNRHDGRLVRSSPEFGCSGANRSIILPSMARSKDCTTAGFAIFRRRTFDVSMATSVTGTTSANSMSTWARPIIISARRRQCRSNCFSSIMARPTPRRKLQPTASAMSI